MRAKANYGWLDRFRIAAALLVVAIHTSPLTTFSEGADFFLTRVLARIAVPFFFMVTGQFVVSGFLASSSQKGMAKLRKYLVKTSLLYLFCIILYLPIGIYAGHYKDLTVGSALRMLVFDGTFYHLWYFPACILGILAVYLMSRFLSLRNMTIVSAVLYTIGLFGDSYFGLVQKVPGLEKAYNFIFQICSYTRNGLFLAPLFLVLGAWMAEVGHKQEKGDSSENFLFSCSLFALSFALMTGEAFLLRHFEFQRHDSMYILLVPVMFFLYRTLLCIPKKSGRQFRVASAWIYILHPAFIVVVRGIAKPLKLTSLLVDNSLVHYLAVAVLSVMAGFVMAWLQGIARANRHTAYASRSRSRSKTQMPEVAEEETWTDESAEAEMDGAEIPDEAWTDESAEAEMNGAEIPDEAWMDEAQADLVYEDEFPYEYAQEAYEEARLAQEFPEEEAPQEQEPAFPREKASASRAWIEVDSNVLAGNVEALRARLPKGCRLMPAVKAQGYGHGAVLISKELNRLGVDAFCVATVGEAVELRQADIHGEILILGYTPPEDFPLLARYQLTQTVIDYPYAKQLNQAQADIHVHIGIDTGMHRVGIRCEDIEDIKSVYELRHLIIDGLFTHLCASDSPLPEHRAFTKTQVRAFYQVVELLKKENYPCPSLHLLASYGILNLLPERGDLPEEPEDQQPKRFAERRMAAAAQKLAADYVRPGIVLYGLLNSEADISPWKDVLKPVLSLKAKVTSLRPLYAGESAGYGITFTAEQDMQIAAISIGYGDGLPRHLSNGRGSVLIHGRRAPIIGRICMDQTIVDVTGIPQVQVGDTVIIIGADRKEEITAGQIAEQCGTISHEIVCRLGERLDRVLV